MASPFQPKTFSSPSLALQHGRPLSFYMSYPLLPAFPSVPLGIAIAELGRPSAASSSSTVVSYIDDDHERPMIPHPAPFSSLVKPSRRHQRSSHHSVLRLFRSLCRTLPIFTPKCKIPASCKIALPKPDEGTVSTLAGGRRHITSVTTTLFGYRKGRVSLAIQETPRCLPSLIVELAIPTHVLMRDISSGMVRIALECEKNHEHRSCKLLDEPLWTMFCNGKKSGYGVRREANCGDLIVMELLRAVSMGAGVLPGGKSEREGAELGEMTYMRANFEYIVASKDSETLYMLGPEVTEGPELTIFFIRI